MTENKAQDSPDDARHKTEGQDIKKTPKTANRKAVSRLVFITCVVALCLFGSAGTIAWFNGWVFLASYILVLLTLTGLVFAVSPELVDERMNAASKAKSWDRVIVPILAMVLPLLAVILAGLDRRLGWTRGIGTIWMSAAFIVMIAGNALTICAMRANRFFSSHVRIQEDRGHHVISDGPYGWIRHPGYTGSIMYNMGVPILLGSLPSLIVGLAFAALMTVRTGLEDATLRKELAGYQDYTQKVRWRVIPFIW